MSQEDFVKHREFWFEDGNIVLVAEGTGFRVHRGVLSRHSEVFRDMFLVPQPAEGEETIEGCPVVRLTEDGAEEVALVLEILYDGGHSFYNESAQISSSIALAALQCEDCHLRPLDCDDSGACPVLWEYSDDCLDVFRLARQFNLDNLVVAALYRCSNDISVDDIFGAVSSRTGPSALRLPELLDCMKARQLLVKANSRTLEFLTSWDGSADCLSRTADQDSRCPIAVRAMSSACSFIADITSPSSLFSLEDWFCRQAEAVPAHLCWPCVWDLCGKDSIRRKAIWNEMQQAFCPALGTDPAEDAITS
ncbi:hypothetical protein BC629DRAFT_1518202 [Irpex lacteus]|nr:hypothetical protein BC629DRAFT_1518202 [Irpex lacteus]